jgi:hypothetical protein
MKDWNEVTAFALTLVNAELGTSYGRPAVKINGRSFLYTARETGSFAIASPLPEKEVLMETEPDTFWETDHYRGWPAVLVRYNMRSRDRIGIVITRAWWDRLKKAQRIQFGERP